MLASLLPVGTWLPEVSRFFFFIFSFLPHACRVTFIPEDLRQELLLDLSDRFTPEAYSLFHNNCNNFTDEFAHCLVGKGIPAHITGLPAEVLATPLGAALRPMLQGLEAQLGSVQMRERAVHHPPPASGPSATAASPASAAPQGGEWRPRGSEPAPPPAAARVGPSRDAAAAAGADGPAVPARQSPVADSSPQSSRSGAAEVVERSSAGGAPVAVQPAAMNEAAGSGEAEADMVAARAQFRRAIEAEFLQIVATGVAPNEAARLAVERVKGRGVELAARA
jgi:PPPDE putative peptidase domain